MDIKDLAGAEERINQLLASDTKLANLIKLEMVSLLTMREEFLIKKKMLHHDGN